MKKRADASANKMLKKVRIAIKTTQQEIGGTLFEKHPTTGKLQEIDHTPQTLELMMEGSYHDDGTRISISYREGEQTGIKNARTTISFQKNDPTLVTMTRDGEVRTALCFEEGRRHLSVYQTPYMPFEVAVKTKRVKNRIVEDGTLHLDYTVELKGANAEHADFSLTLLPDIKKPLASN